MKKKWKRVVGKSHEWTKDVYLTCECENWKLKRIPDSHVNSENMQKS